MLLLLFYVHWEMITIHKDILFVCLRFINKPIIIVFSITLHVIIIIWGVNIIFPPNKLSSYLIDLVLFLHLSLFSKQSYDVLHSFTQKWELSSNGMPLFINYVLWNIWLNEYWSIINKSMVLCSVLILCSKSI